MQFEERYTLQCRGPIEGYEPEAVESLLVATEPVAKWAANHIGCGHDDCALYPAWQSGDRAWLLREAWSPANGYSAWGTRDIVLCLEDGIKMLIQHGKLDTIFGANPRVTENTRLLALATNRGQD